ncbi:Ig-like domain repeat protein [Streptomyces sp. NPDC001435]|uniref:Ig-like domain repeat protein n=1 Tax=Streptomyces sp. NPDC001435 TaxID=3364576 RepID=UPI0036C4722B
MSLPVQARAATQPPAPSAYEQQYLSSSPPDLTVPAGIARPRSVRPRQLPGAAEAFVIDADASASTSTGGGRGEPSIAINPANPDEIAITRFNFQFWQNGNADLLYSDDGGAHWTENHTIPTPGLTDAPNGPYDQTIDYGRDGRLYGSFLACNAPTAGPPAVPECNTTRVVTGSTTDPTNAASWSWNGNPAQVTSGTRTGVDQPWVLVNRDTTTAAQDNVYAAYQDLAGTPDARVGVSYGANPVNITADNVAGTMSPLTTNGGLRLAKDPRNGTMYALYQQSTGTFQPNSVLRNQPVRVTYRLNRSDDGGAHWRLNNDNDGIVVATEDSDQGLGYKFGGVNALLGGVDHAAVDPGNGDVYVVYGADVSGNNQLRIRRLTDNGSGGLNVGAAVNVSGATNAALPSVAVLSDGTIGVLYDTFDGNNTAGFPTFTAHLARSKDQGATFTDTVLQTFASPEQDRTGCNATTQPPNPNPPDLDCARQRVLGDYQQLKAVGHTFYGTFIGNTNGANPTTTPPMHAMFFTVPQKSQTSLASSANPSVYGQPVTFTATVAPVPDGGTVSFETDGSALGGPVPVNTTTGEATSAAISTLSPGTHTVNAAYSGNDNFRPSAAPPLIQTVSKAPVATTLSSSANPSGFGTPVTFTDTVCPSGASTDPAAPPTGTVTVKDGTTVLGTPTLTPGGGPHCSQVQVTTSNLLPGPHTITADYGGDADYLAAGTETLAQTVSCTRTITGQVNNAVIATGDSTCIIDATVRGAVVGGANAALFISNSTIGGGVQSSGGTLFGMCGSTVVGSVQVSRASGFVVIGDPGDDHCPGNHLRGVQLTDNHSGAELVGNDIGGSVQVNGTTGTGPFPVDDRAAIVGNTVQGSLSCVGNTPPPTNRGTPNTVLGSRAGQCSAL